MIALLAGPALAQDRPSDEDIFGPPAAPVEAAPTTPEPGPKAAPGAGGDERFGEEPGAAERIAGRIAETADLLRVGGQLYLRSFAFAREGQAASDWTTSSPSLLDVYLDARPNDRVRAFVLVRGSHDPTVDEEAATPLPDTGDEVDPSQPLPIPGLTAGGSRDDVALDQAWIRFDVDRTVFVTAGKQHVKWGVGRFWNPTDFLHVARRDPLATFDARTGTTMVRVHVPWERRGWNFHAAAVLEPLLPAKDADAPASNELGAVGGAARAELVFGAAELGIGGVVQGGRPARLGVDLSAGLWELDVYGELALRSETERKVWRDAGGPSAPLVQRFAATDPGGLDAAATLGGTWSWKYSDEDTLTIGAEGFWQRHGYDDRDVYPWLLAQGDFLPFQVGRWYAGAFVALPDPGSWNDTTVTLSTLGNLSDRSFESRVDLAFDVLTHLRLEAFAAVHYGRSGGEFRLGLDVPPQDLGNGVFTPRIEVADPLVDLGLALRVAL